MDYELLQLPLQLTFRCAPTPEITVGGPEHVTNGCYCDLVSSTVLSCMKVTVHSILQSLEGHRTPAINKQPVCRSITWEWGDIALTLIKIMRAHTHTHTYSNHTYISIRTHTRRCLINVCYSCWGSIGELRVQSQQGTFSRILMVLQEWAGWSCSSFSSGHLEVGETAQQ